MDRSALLARLQEGAAALGEPRDAAILGRLIDYLDLLQKWNRTYNLTAITEPDRMLTHHLLDSLAVAPFVGPEPVLDVGSGGGLPGIPLALVRPGLAVTLLDSSHKKCAFMQQAVIELGLAKRVTVVQARVEAWRHAPFAQIISRAYGDLDQFVRQTRHLLAPGGRWLAMKGVFPHEEVQQLETQLCKEARVSGHHRLNIPGLDAERHLIIMEPAA